MIGNSTQFAQYMGVSRQYVGKLKQKGRLVFVGDKIDFEQSKIKMEQTADISRQDVFNKTKPTTPKPVPEKPVETKKKKNAKTPKRPAGKKKTTTAKNANVAAEAKTKQPDPEQHETAQTPGMDGSIREQFNLARAAYQGYQAKLKKIEYERTRGTLGSLDQIQKVGFEIGKIIKTRMATFAIRAAPVVTHETSEKVNREYLMREVENVIAEIREELEQKKGE